MKNKYYKKNNKHFKISDDVMKNGFLIGCHHGLKENHLKYMFKTFDKFFKIYKL